MRHLFLFIILISGTSLFGQSQIRMNEACSRNLSIISDEDGDFEDWIEIHNQDTISINLKDFYLSDDSDDPQMWNFPDISIQANEYLLIFASGKDRRTPIHHWETVLYGDSTWYYLNPQEQSDEDYILWTENDYDVSGWEERRGGFGYGYNNIQTLSDSSTIYLKQDFYISDTSKILSCILHAYYKDGFVVYLNGFEIMRPNMMENGVKPEIEVPAFKYHPSNIDSEEPPESFPIDPYLWKNQIKNGRNVLAIQCHKKDTTGLVIKPWLSLSISDSIYQNDSLAQGLEVPPLPLHSNFKISGDGEKIYLFHKEQGLIQRVNVPGLPTNISYGMHRWIKDSLVYFDFPTPGNINAYQFKEGIIKDSVQIVNTSGFYQDSVLISVINPDTIYQPRYTLDGSMPSLGSPLYDNPFYLDSTSLFRIAYFSDTLIKGPVTSVTYFLNDESSLDVISIITDPQHLWNQNTGIYVYGSHYWYYPPYFGANFWQNWEKPAHIQYFNSNKDLVWQQDAGIKIHGNYTRQLPQKSFGFYAKSEYGISRFNHTFIPDKEYIKDPKRFLVRNAGNDYSYARFRDLLIHRRMEPTGLDVQNGKPVLAFLNGDYWGLYNLREKIDRFYLENNQGVDPEAVNLLEQNGLIISGNRNDFEEIMTYVKSTDLSIESNFNYIEELVDLDNWIDNLISNIYHLNTDWPHHNTKFWNAPGIKWRQILVDQDVTMGYSGGHTANKDPFPRIHEDSLSYLAICYNHFLKNKGFKQDYANRFADLMNTILLPEDYLPLVDEIVEEMTAEIERHGNKWQHNTEFWENGYYPDRVRTFIEERIPYMRQFLKSHYQLGANDTINLSVNPEGKGQIKLNTIYITENFWSGIYFDSIPIRLEAIPNPGYEFVAWLSPTSPQLADSSRIIENWFLKSNDSITAIFYSESGQEDTLQIAFTEFNYRSYDNAEADDWIEIYNLEDDTIYLNGWSIQGYKPFENWKFPIESKIAPQSFLVIAHDTSAFNKTHTQVSNIIGPLSFKLKSVEEELKLLDEFDRMVSKISFSRNSPWPMNENTSKTIELAVIESDYHMAENWQLGCPGGSPGEAPKNCEQEYPLIFTEINYKSHVNYPSGDWIELLNNSNDTIDISSWIFRDGNPDNAFVFHENTLLYPNEKVLLIEDTLAFFNVYKQKGRYFGPMEFGFSASGENLSLHNPFDLEIISIEYSNAEPWPEDASGTGFTIELIDNTIDMQNGESWMSNCFLGTPWERPESCIQADVLFISEVKYQSKPGEESGDWIELYNQSDKEVNLMNWSILHQTDTISIDTNYLLNPENYVIISADTALFYSLYDRNIDALYANPFDLRKDEDYLLISNPYHFTGHLLSYHYLLNWPLFQTDTNNRTLELIDYNQILLADSWRASCENGTPGLSPSFCITEGLEETNSNAYEVLIHPNPSATFINLDVYLEEAEELSISISNMQSHIVFMQKTDWLYSGRQTIKLNLESLKTGVYLMEIRGQKGSLREKIIKIEE